MVRYDTPVEDFIPEQNPSVSPDGFQEFLLCDKQDLVNIANAIRAKQNSTTQYGIEELAEQIKNISNSSFLGNAMVTFKQNGVAGKFYYLQHIGNGTQRVEEQFGSGKDLTVEIAKYSFVYSKEGFFDNTTFIIPDNGYIVPIDSHCFYIGNIDKVEISYADGAPI